MDLLLIMTYTAICVAVFKVFKLPLNKWTVPTAALGGVVLIGTLIFAMNYNHPYSEVSRSYFTTIQIVPQVAGKVIEVTESRNQKLKQGDVLLKIDPTPFETSLATLKAELISAEADLVRAKKLTSKNALAKRELDIARRQVDELLPKVTKAQWDLDNTVIRAPSDGYVSQVAVRPGVRAVPLPLAPVMVFIPDESRHFVGWFRQNSMLRLKPGYEAEIAFDGLPGEVFSARVKQVLPAMSQGQVSASGVLLDGSRDRYAGRIGVELLIDDPDFAQYDMMVPGGSYGQAAIYSEHMHHVSVMRKVLLRMSAWMNYIFPFH